MCSLSPAQRAPGAAQSVAGAGSLPEQCASTACHAAGPHRSVTAPASAARVTTHLFPVLPSVPSTVVLLPAAGETEALTLCCCWPQLSHQPAQALLVLCCCFPLLFFLSTWELSRFLDGVCGPQTMNELALVSKGWSPHQVMGLCSCVVPWVLSRSPSMFFPF